MKNNIESIIKYLKGSNDDFIVTSHISPDGDNIGSTLSMYYALNKLGKNVYYVLDDNPPQNLKFLVENMNILKSEEVNLDSYNIVALDCGDKNRICISQNLIDNAKKIICIDHHASNDYYGDFNYIDTEASSTCELVYNLLVECEKNENINKNNNINDNKNDTIRFVHEETVPVNEYPEIQVIRTTGEQDVTILSLNLNGDEIFWHQKGDTLIFDQPITAKENTVKVIAVIDGRRIVHMPIWEF